MTYSTPLLQQRSFGASMDTEDRERKKERYVRRRGRDEALRSSRIYSLGARYLSVRFLSGGMHRLTAHGQPEILKGCQHGTIHLKLSDLGIGGSLMPFEKFDCCFIHSRFQRRIVWSALAKLWRPTALLRRSGCAKMAIVDATRLTRMPRESQF